MVPNNVKQELKLWETIRLSNNPQFLIGDDPLYHRDYS